MKQEKGTLILLQKYQLRALWRAGMGQGGNEQVPVPLCTLEGHGVMPSPREHADLQEIFPCGSVPVRPQFIRLLWFICFMPIESCFCTFWIYSAQSKTSQLSCVYWKPSVRIRSEDEQKWTPRTGAALEDWELGLNCHSHTQAQFLLTSYLTSLLSTCTVSCHPVLAILSIFCDQIYHQINSYSFHQSHLEFQICFTL